jgi:hypothetical protein
MNFQAAEQSRDQAAQGAASPRGEGSREFEDPGYRGQCQPKKAPRPGEAEAGPQGEKTALDKNATELPQIEAS